MNWDALGAIGGAVAGVATQAPRNSTTQHRLVHYPKGRCEKDRRYHR